jgi:mRNA interferase MazF
MPEDPTFDSLERGHVVLAPDPFKSEDEATRPWVIVNNENHPFDEEQYISMGLTTKTWYDERIPLEEEDYLHRRAPEKSSIIPHSVASISPNLMTDYICQIRDHPLDEAVDELMSYLKS